MTASTLFTKLARVMGQIDALTKDGKNAHFDYKFTTDEVVYAAVRGHLSEAGIAVLASMVGVHQETITGSKGQPQLHTRCDFEFIFADGESGETAKCLWSAEAIGSDDKGINKSATAALKYWLLKTFIIPSGDDPDFDAGAYSGRKSAGMKTEDPRPANGKPVYDSKAAMDALAKHYEGRWTRDEVRKALGKLDPAGMDTAQVIEAFKAKVAEADTKRMAEELGGELAAPKE